MKRAAILTALAATAVVADATAQLPAAPIPSVGAHFEVQGIVMRETGDDFANSNLGYGGTALLGPSIGGTSVLGLVGYRIVPFDGSGVSGGSGDDHILTLGGQLRFRLGAPLVPVAPWIGFHGAYVKETSRAENSTGDDPTATGWEVGGQFGLSLSRINLFVGVGYLSVGDFTFNDAVALLGGDGLTLHGGIGLRIL